ncbi:ferritin-like domain-containing protein [Mechercharimyces sp. CAU 1602]|uniref:ferritin-like domain-containing protein n=1 Tax=Mechercharimyces sp. CAU 1602 TaxID=2973933 RepID=UPI002163147D|nr:ferritin-like domain-containing protein [Mechercharimyces sp. CAU 1602]MCS1351953.1 ferritin-like domain-containing protein [Mechercharimyces sp. CAU 1602]
MDAKLKTLIDGLNEDLGYEYAAVIQYTNNAAVVSGLSRQTLKPFFEAEARDEIGHASYLAEKIATLGGDPVVEPKPVKMISDVRTMLQHARDEEAATIKRYKERMDQAEAVGEIALKIQLEDMIADETNHKEELERLLKDPRL